MSIYTEEFVVKLGKAMIDGKAKFHLEERIIISAHSIPNGMQQLFMVSEIAVLHLRFQIYQIFMYTVAHKWILFSMGSFDFVWGRSNEKS